MTEHIQSDRRFRSRAGLTLVEVMLAMVIMTIGGIVLITSVSQCLGVVRAARLYNHAHALLARIELEHPLFDEDIQEGADRGYFSGTEYGNFEWSRTIETVGEEEDRLFEIRTRVSWTRRGRAGYEEVVYYRHAPEEE